MMNCIPNSSSTDKRKQNKTVYISLLILICVSFSLGQTMAPAHLYSVKVEGKFGFINESGKITIPPQFEDTAGFSEGFAAVKRLGKWGYVKPDGSFLIEPEFDEAQVFSDGLASVRSGDLWGALDNQGRLAIPFQLRDALFFQDGVSPLETSTGQFLGYVGHDGRLVLPASRIAREITGASEFSEGTAAVSVFRLPGGSVWRLIDKSGKFVSEAEFKCLAPGRFVNGLAPVSAQCQGKTGYIDKRGGFVITPRFDRAEVFSENLAAVSVGGKWGYINTSGAFVVQASYDEAGPFSSGRAMVRKGSLWGFIDTSGVEVIPAQFAVAGAFDGALAPVKRRKSAEDGKVPLRFITGYIDETTAYIDRDGNYVWSGSQE